MPSTNSKRYDAKRTRDIKNGDGEAFWHYKAGSVNATTQKRGGKRFVRAADIKRLWVDQQGRCYYCDVELRLGCDRRRRGTISVDHVKVGVNEVFNLVICCNRCNILKNGATLAEMERIVERTRAFIAQRQGLYDAAEAAPSNDFTTASEVPPLLALMISA